MGILSKRNFSSVEINSLEPVSWFDFPQPDEIHWATVKDRPRNSGLTSVRLIDETRVIAADFGNKRVYLARIDGDDLQILDTHSTVLADGTPVETDLIDYRDGLFVVSNFHQGTVSAYEIVDDTIRFQQEIDLGGPKNIHGVRFVPGYPNLLWATFCNRKEPQSRIFCLKTKQTLHVLPGKRQCQDVAFTGEYGVVFARTNHISAGNVKPGLFSKKNRMVAEAYIYRLPKDLNSEAPRLVRKWNGEGHIDAVMELGPGRLAAANQYLNRVDIMDVSSDGKLGLSHAITGMNFPHGLDVLGSKVAVTNYGDQKLCVFDLPPEHGSQT